MYSGADFCAMINLEAKLKINLMLTSNIKLAREQLCQDAISRLTHYRKVVSTSSGSTQFVLPETMKFYPIMLLGLMKTAAFALIEDAKLDCKVANIAQLSSCSFSQFWTRVYPKVFSISAIIQPDSMSGTIISDESNGSVNSNIIKPINIPSSMDKLSNNDAFIITNCDYIYIYVPELVQEDILQQVRLIFIFCNYQ